MAASLSAREAMNGGPSVDVAATISVSARAARRASAATMSVIAWVELALRTSSRTRGALRSVQRRALADVALDHGLEVHARAAERRAPGVQRNAQGLGQPERRHGEAQGRAFAAPRPRVGWCVA